MFAWAAALAILAALGISAPAVAYEEQTTNATPVTFLHSQPTANCTETTGSAADMTISPFTPFNTTITTTILADSPLAAAFSSNCSSRTSSVTFGHFHDPDGDTLSFTVNIDFPEKVRSNHAEGEEVYPQVVINSNGSAILQYNFVTTFH